LGCAEIAGFKKDYNLITIGDGFVPYLCQIEVKTSKNKHNQIKPNKNWKFMGIKELWRIMMCH